MDIQTEIRVTALPAEERRERELDRRADVLAAATAEFAERASTARR
jgi:hypothetical protein